MSFLVQAKKGGGLPSTPEQELKLLTNLGEVNDSSHRQEKL